MHRFKKAEERTGIPAIVWQLVAESAKMKAEMTTTTEPEILNDHHELEGVPIGVGEAARKYAIPSPTISRWVKEGLIKVIRRPPGGQKGLKVELNEASVALAADLYHQNPGQGKNPLKLLKRNLPRQSS